MNEKSQSVPCNVSSVDPASEHKKWETWGPYLADRQWGTVREDYSPDGSAWEYVSHDISRSKAYRWGEDGIGGFSDSLQFLCLAWAFWNENDPIIKERLFGLTGNEGNHGEDVKELYYHIDGTPTHSYMKMLYKYPQAEFPYDSLVQQGKQLGKTAPELELIDTGIFNDNRYFDVFIEYAKASADDLLSKATIFNRGPESAVIHVIPQLWFRNTWGWGSRSLNPSVLPLEKPLLAFESGSIQVQHKKLGERWFYWDGDTEPLFCDNETNSARLYSKPTKGPVKDGINDFIVSKNVGAIDREKGTKAAVDYYAVIPPGKSYTVRLRLANTKLADPFESFAGIFAERIDDTNTYYKNLQQDILDPDMRRVQRQAFAGMLWTKQFYYFDLPEWIKGDDRQPRPPEQRKKGRNADWLHVNTADIISMPDKWEYPWFAAWDLAFHCIPLAMVDPVFAKKQLLLLTREWYMHPNGQLPAYEWAFGDVNPPVHAWATWRVFQIDRKARGDKGDLAFLERVFHKLMLNFTWWVNRKDAEGRNIFQGGFLGLDNIGVFDRSAPLPTGGYINQSDGTSWMAMYCLNLMRIALELARHNHVYEDIATKFFEHFLHIAEAMASFGDTDIGLWDEEDEFYYDELRVNGRSTPLKIRSMVGLIPLFAVETLDPELLAELPAFNRRLKWFLRYRPDLAKLVSRWNEPGLGERHLLSLLRGHRMKRLLNRMLDESEFLSEYGIRALSKYHENHPFSTEVGDRTYTVSYNPAESDSHLFGGNSNWRGPIWFPVNFLLVESLQKFHHYYGDDFKIECPTGSGNMISILQAADELSKRLISIFVKDKNGNRPVFGDQQKMQTDPYFADNLLFYEYFHGDNGRGVGASHQTGWTGLVAKLIQPRRK